MYKYGLRRILKLSGKLIPNTLNKVNSLNRPRLVVLK
jgi:hypothetical protein